MAKKRMPIYVFGNESKFIRISISTIKLHILYKFQLNISKNMDFMAEDPQKFPYKQLYSPIALFVQSQSLKSLIFLHFSIFLLENLNLASQLNLAAIVLT